MDGDCSGYVEHMAAAELVEQLVNRAFEIAEKPAAERIRDDYVKLADLAGNDAEALDAALQRIRLQRSEVGSTKDLWEDAADAITEAAQIGGHEIRGVPGIAIRRREK